ncbi:Proteasome/cyclosome repeat-containing protein [Besnoitia besnoiti]|uniref:Proteasome/cyclosome repeat-containing protein n=1 Tax=Besnoitia besnoiti TaxID=94643 RepID=A0A2A9MGX5_BESBE|nr:Proteasome/cyclosome repeat-containing protein [Besnoitia besnoiti]PFH37778.1 Proteasome/cyclosome repeat-containing protein [Besnoitia besnoiti]
MSAGAAVASQPLPLSSSGGKKANARPVSSPSLAFSSASSAAGVLALLHEREPALQAAALHRLLEMIDLWWTEIADYLADIEALYEDETFPERQLAGFVASRVYFHLEEYGEATKFALGSGKWFDITKESLYVQRILSECVDTFIQTGLQEFGRQQLAAGRQVSIQLSEEVNMDDGQAGSAALNEAIEDVVKRLLQVCVEQRGDGALYALGVAFDARRLDLVRAVFNAQRALALPPTNPNSKFQLMLHCLDHLQTLISSKCFRSQVVSLLTAEFEALLPVYDSVGGAADAENALSREQRAEICGLLYSALCRCLVQQDDSGRIAELLAQLLSPETEETNRADEGLLTACQIAFDILQMERQSFQQALLDHPLMRAPQAADASAPSAADSVSSAVASGEAGAAATVNGEASATEPKEAKEKEEESEEERKKKLLRYILSGEAQNAFIQQFLQRENHADLMLLDLYKRSIDSRSSLLHHGVVLSHMLMQAGTSCDVFLRCNLDWMARASNWARFSATASLGVVHKGHVRDSMKLLRTYLPTASSSSASSSPYSEGGAFYALGLISANQPSASVREYLLQQLQAAGTASEPKQQGCCLGLGLLCMGFADDTEVYEALKQVLFLDSAVAGEAAALAVGLLLLGSANAAAVSELLAYAQDTQHEKIRRACGVAIALLVFKKEEEADALIDQLCKECDPLIRYGGMFTIAMAYCATANSSAIRRLLHVSVSDVSDDVRRAAVIALGFVLCGDKQQLPPILKILSASFNPHVRYGAALALGLACSGTGQKDVVDLLLPLANDSTDFVRQGAFIGLGLVLQQVTEAACSEAASVRQLFQRVIADKHEDVIARFGALLGSGLIDAGGRNVVASMFSASGVLRQEAAVGFCLAFQLWYWYPLIHTISLSFSSCALIGLTVSPAPSLKKDVKAKDASERAEEDNKGGEKKETEGEKKEEGEKEEKKEKEEEKDEKAGAESGSALVKRETEEQEASEKSEVSRAGLSKLRMPAGWTVTCAGGKQSQFAYWPSLASLEKKEGRKQTVKAILSTTAKRNRKLQEQKKKENEEKKKQDGKADENVKTEDAMDVEEEAAKEAKTDAEAPKKPEDGGAMDFDFDEKGDVGKSKEKPKKAEGDEASKEVPKEVELKNPCRVLPQQQPFIHLQPHSRYQPIFPGRKAGFVLLRDTKPTEPDEFLEPKGETPAEEQQPAEEKEPEAFTPFEWSG